MEKLETKCKDLLNNITAPISPIALGLVEEEEKPLLIIPADKSYIQILDHKIDESFESFEEFAAYLQHIRDVEKENAELQRKKKSLIRYLEDKIEMSKLERTYIDGECFPSVKEQIYNDILKKVKEDGNE